MGSLRGAHRITACRVARKPSKHFHEARTPSAAICECIDIRRGAGGRIAVELGARTVEVSGMKEPVQSVTESGVVMTCSVP